ncbi:MULTISPECIES: family 43 glycosylhydrolase [unclassified Microbacterium]|uniref:family 43 glycosylhydrolase n=1 Tax=unclassified Microbacterium TaxID=2609290 RepID=UPI00214B28DE|nr:MULTISPECIES: family 43 glycosylhydrolase [unclassified Microbacterium]MCR2783544.1 family 43 glycosylhydrolase [Microbacterium sp. zg.B96]WIM15595.1 family 43 glycosylhydrolase [Microbacterium sp. zg-B96]
MSTDDTIRPGHVWLDSDGKRIQAHGGSIFHEDGIFTWYGENKERTTPGSGIWHWGVRAYTSIDLVNWEDRGLIIPPVIDDESSPLHPAQKMDRPHIIYNRATGKYVCWLKVMGEGSHDTQASTVLVADSLLGPYDIVRTGLEPLGMSAGDFDLVVDSATGRAYYYFEKVHTELICAELSEDYTDVSGEFSSHFRHPGPPFTREAPAHFERNGIHYLLTSGSTGYFPNFTEVAAGPDYHGPFDVLGLTHRDDEEATSFRSQISSVFKHPQKQDLYIALADRWLPQLPVGMPNVYDSVAARMRGEAPKSTDVAPGVFAAAMAAGSGENTAIADYVWLPIQFDGDRPYIQWLDEWRVDDFD